MQGIGLFFTALAIVFGGIVGVNVYQGGAILKDARAELTALQLALGQLHSAKSDYQAGLNDLKATADKIILETSNSIKSEAHETLNNITRRAYRNTTLEEHIEKIKAEVSQSNPSEDTLYPLVTALFGYKDAGVLEAFQKCIEVLPANSETTQEILKHGLPSFLKE